MDNYIILWVIIQNYSYIFCSSFSSIGHWELLSLVLCSFEIHITYTYVFLLFLFVYLFLIPSCCLVPQDASGSSWMFSAPSLNQLVLQGCSFFLFLSSYMASMLPFLLGRSEGVEMRGDVGRAQTLCL